MAVLPPRLLALSPGTLMEGEGASQAAFLRQAKELIAEGLRGILLREPNLGDAELLHLARELKSSLVATEDDAAWLGVHDALHVALAADADGVHLGFRSLDVETARAVVGDTMCIGLSTHRGDDAATWTDAEYVFHSPVFPTPSKEGLLEPIGADELYAFAAEHGDTSLVFGLGGIDAQNCAALLANDTGNHVYGVAVRGALFESPDARENLTVLLRAQKTCAPPENHSGLKG